jgi:two-component system response regulator GlrR
VASFRVVICGQPAASAAPPFPDEAIERVAPEAPDAAVDAFIVYAGATVPAWRAPSTPIVQIGGACDDKAAVWLASSPSPSLLTSILGALVEARPAERPADPAHAFTWRRKSDMIVGRSEAVRALLSQLDRLAASSASVLILGESGTGKELVARALHYCGPRRRAPFIAINCAAIPESLFESELFGHEKGAFTGADVARVGAFEAAHEGTLFLDEIGELPRTMQSKLLRVLETGEVSRLGARAVRNVSVRVVAATNRELQREVKQARFREDLYYRLSVYPIHIVPLRERREDIPALIQHHLSIIAARQRRPMPRVSSAALEKLLAHSWPGNVRELVNVLERATLVGDERIIGVEQLALPATEAAAALSSYREAKAEFERDYFTRLMRVAAGNISLAAKLADKTRKEIYEALRRVGANASGFRDDEASASSESGTRRFTDRS